MPANAQVHGYLVLPVIPQARAEILRGHVGIVPVPALVVVFGIEKIRYIVLISRDFKIGPLAVITAIECPNSTGEIAPAAFGDDIDHPSDRIVTVKDRPSAPDDLDTLNGTQRYLDKIGAGNVHVVDFTAIDHDEDIARGRIAEAPDVDNRRFSGAVVVNIDAKGLPKNIGNGLRVGRLDLRAVNDRNIAGDLVIVLRHAAGGDDDRLQVNAGGPGGGGN